MLMIELMFMIRVSTGIGPVPIVKFSDPEFKGERLEDHFERRFWVIYNKNDEIDLGKTFQKNGGFTWLYGGLLWV